jgi:hypothetical protein
MIEAWITCGSYASLRMTSRLLSHECCTHCCAAIAEASGGGGGGAEGADCVGFGVVDVEHGEKPGEL